MKIVGIMPVRNEDWILGFSLRVALKWCDEVVVFMHDCTDGTVGIVQRLLHSDNSLWERVQPLACSGEPWDEMRHRQSLLYWARERGATHVAMIDADEVLTANLLPTTSDWSDKGDLMDLRIRRIVQGTPSGWMLDLPLYNLRENWAAGRVADYSKPLGEHLGPPAVHYHSNGIWGNRWVATAFMDDPKLNWQGDTFHHREPFGADWRGKRSRPIPQTDGGVLHFWGASERRLRAKHALYRITERLRWPKKPDSVIEYGYDPATNPNSKMAQDLRLAGPWKFNAVKPEWIEPYADLMQYLHMDREPWQEAEVRRLVLEHGAEKFSGLDLLGVV